MSTTRCAAGCDNCGRSVGQSGCMCQGWTVENRDQGVATHRHVMYPEGLANWVDMVARFNAGNNEPSDTSDGLLGLGADVGKAVVAAAEPTHGQCEDSWNQVQGLHRVRKPKHKTMDVTTVIADLNVN